MKCNEIRSELVAYDRDELPAEDAARVARHLDACQACREELAAVQGTMATVRAGLVPVEPDADARTRLRERLGQGPRALSSRRLLSRPQDDGLRWPERLRRRVRQSPYVGASLLLHAAALLLLAVGLPLAYHYTQDAGPGPDGVEVEMPAARALYAQRRRAPRQRLALEQGTLDQTKIRRAAAVYLAGDPTDRCIWAFPVGGAGNRSEERFLSVFSAEERQILTRVDTRDGALELPDRLRQTYLAEAGAVVVIDLIDQPKKGRFELWAPQRWEEYTEAHAKGGEVALQLSALATGGGTVALGAIHH
jgi:anti-sigma factor RsiW